ncbi:uncharacterized protein J7T54_004700 [Emericellopsis cladophorae]|uniref:Heterokaryon incompatibility domain-containing protein n=1 Tax=Emericellopsis cladophorae TaxID=2686198 RepID=A0A9P9Y781_9HYPO|nr:uncharacterized protein J7T54_004700 [Emericellopsis cladophorae]KAI6784154.1 hypothetical protein J7T54_004700 [Emericellopsis cladophorae]
MTVTDKIQHALRLVCDSASRRRPPSSSPNVSRQQLEPERQNQERAESLPDLCANCGKLDLYSLLLTEKPSKELAPLSDYLEPDCPFCNLLSRAVQSQWGEGWSSSRLVAEADQIPNAFIQSRSPISLKRDGVTEHPEPRLLLALDTSPPGYSENRRVIREVDRVKDRYIIAEIESVSGGHGSMATNSLAPSLIPRRAVDADIDYEMVRQWLRDCKQHAHTAKALEQMESDRFDTELFGAREGFRLIDVQDECLVLKNEPCAFAALSYVWGCLPTILRPCGKTEDVPILLTTRNNLESLSTPGGLSKASIEAMHSVRLPQTVTDAMEFSRRIGMGYLWIDTLCIVQDDKEDKGYLIQAMDNVYDIATVTYIAVSGKNADAGLSGVSPRRGRTINAVTIVDEDTEIHLSLAPPTLNDEVRSSVWNTRGWTFQEQALSQRCLYFTEDEVYFNCIQLQWREAYALESLSEVQDLTVRTGPPWWNRKLRKDLDPTPYRYLGDLTGTLTIKDYQAAVQDYSRKTLTFPEDVLHAFEGVFNRFTKGVFRSKLSLEQTQGIPADYLYQAMLWFPSEETRRRVCEDTDVFFSSWSWASWDGPIEFVFGDSLWLSRNISQAPMKKKRMHVLTPYWHYGDSARKFWTDEMWKAACEGVEDASVTEQCHRFMSYAQDKLGIDMKILRDQGASVDLLELQLGELGFVGACIQATNVVLERKTEIGPICSLEIGPHKGEFRFDDTQSTHFDDPSS